MQTQSTEVSDESCKVETKFDVNSRRTLIRGSLHLMYVTSASLNLEYDLKISGCIYAQMPAIENLVLYIWVVSK